MITVDHEVAYPHDAQQVFAVLADLDGFPAWQSDVLEAHLTGPLREGAAVAQVRQVMGRRTEVSLTVTEYLPGERITLRTAPGTRPGVTQSYGVRPAGQGCAVEFHLELDGVPRMAEHLVKAQLTKQVQVMFERLSGRLR
ncbi:SRPBCC family protein [Streptosporangium sp. KLBMP 9127]|nr:SRPBCC family protein [Streptosporangium sp. KLBMP 9127]